ncbi:hypothetical protein WDU94_002335 [Cyamophila willieti]
MNAPTCVKKEIQCHISDAIIKIIEDEDEEKKKRRRRRRRRGRRRRRRRRRRRKDEDEEEKDEDEEEEEEEEGRIRERNVKNLQIVKVPSFNIATALLVTANEFFVDDHKISDEFFKGLQSSKTPEERLNALNGYIATYSANKTKEAKEMPFIYRKIYGNTAPIFSHDEVKRIDPKKLDPECVKKLNTLPLLKRVWSKSNHQRECPQCNGLNNYKRQIDEKMLEKMHNLTRVEEELRHGKNHEKCHSHGNCDSHDDSTIEETHVIFDDGETYTDEKRREEVLLKEKKRKEAIEKLNYHFYRRAVMEAKLTGEAPEKIFKQYHRMNPQELQQRFHAVYQKYLEMRKKMQDYYKNNQHKEGEIQKEYVKSLEKKEGLEKHLDNYQKFLKEVEDRKRQQEEEKKVEDEHRKAKEQKDKEEEYKRAELVSLDKQLTEINVLKANIQREIERTKKEGDQKDLASLEKLENELHQWEYKVKTDKEFKLSSLNVVADKVNELRDKLLAELKHDVVHGQHRNEESFENAKKRYLHVKDNFNKQVNRVRDNLVGQNNEDYDSSVYKDDEEEEEEEPQEDYNTHERQLMDIDDLKNRLTDELDKAKREGKFVRDIYQLEGARKQIEDWEEKIKADNVHHYEKASLVNKKINEFRGFINSYKVYKYSTTAAPEA